MVTVVTTPRSNFGGALGTGLGQGLEALAQYKLQQVQQRQQVADRSALYQGAGVPKEYADLVANGAIPENQIGYFLSSVLQSQPQQQFQTQPLNQSLQHQQHPGTSIDQQGLVQPINRQQGTPIGANPNLPQNQSKIPVTTPQAQQQQKFNLGQALIPQRERREEEKLALKKQQVETGTHKEAREFLKPYEHAAEASRKNVRDYNMIRKIARSGELRAGNTHQVLSALGLEKFNRNTPTQIAEKLIARLGQNAGSAFGTGTRITNFLEQTFQRSNPSLFNTPEAIAAIADLNIIADEINILKEKAAIDYVRQNKGQVSYDANAVINEKIGDQIEALEDQAMQIAQDTFDNKQSGPKFNDNRQLFGGKQFEVGQSLNELPALGSSEFKSLPNGFQLTDDKGIIYTKVGNSWNKKKG